MASIKLPFLFIFFALVRGEVPAIIVFGDSTVDAGNNNVISTMVKSNFHPYGRDFDGGRPTGRFSNGRIPTDFISEAFGLKPFVPAYLDPKYSIEDFATGVSFASAGTGYDNVTSNFLNVIPLWQEMEYFLDYQSKLRETFGNERTSQIITEALYVVSVGTNDFIQNYYAIPTRRSQFTIEEFQDFLVNIANNFLTQLYNLGAKKISFTELPPMGCLPMERTANIFTNRDCIQSYNDVALQFNDKLGSMVSQLNNDLPGLKIIYSRNVYNTLLTAITDPAAYGFEVSSLACCASGTFEMGFLCNWRSATCPDASKYVFWDAFHPTEKTNKILADQLLNLLIAEFH